MDLTPLEDRTGTPPQHCAPATKALAQIDVLGQAYNEVEEYLNRLEEQGRSLCKRMAAVEEGLETVSKKPAEAAMTAASIKAANAGRGSKQAVGQPSLELLSTSALAQELIRRLGAGDTLGVMLERQLHASFPSIYPANIPSTIESSSRRTTLDPCGELDPPRPVKRPRGRPRSDSLSAQPTSRSPLRRGRPPTHGRFVGKGKIRMPSTSSEEPQTQPVSCGTPASFGHFEATGKVKTQAYATPASPVPKVLETSDTSSGAKVPWFSTPPRTAANDTSKAPDLSQSTESYVDDSLEGLSVYIQGSAEPIPPERRSERTPKPIKDKNFVSWKDLAAAKGL